MSFTNEQAHYISDGAMSQAIQEWQNSQPEREQSVASPSQLTACPRVVWRYKHGVEPTNPKTWAFKQRLMLGRNFENIIAKQLKDTGKLLYHWKDDVKGESVKFSMGEGDGVCEGTPDLLLKLDKVVISDAKTARGDSFGYTPIDDTVWADPFWYKYKLQLTAYYMLCHKNKDWFDKNKLPLPEQCHLFSYAMDDGVIRREFLWTPNQKDASEVIYYIKRWNRAYVSKTEPECKCTSKDAMFCPYADLSSSYVTKKGKTLYKECCK